MTEENWIARVWNADATLWRSEPEHVQEITNRLGWLHLPTRIMPQVEMLQEFSGSLREEFDRIVLLGMGGSSLAPWCFNEIFGAMPDHPAFSVLDSTVPDDVLTVNRGTPLDRCLFIVSSKSGTTSETDAFFDYFYGEVGARKEEAGENFVIITDPGSPLLRTGDERQVRAVFENWQDIGGRYSALSYFGMVPAALMGLPLRRIIERAEEMANACSPEAPADENPGAALGAFLGCCHEIGRDKVTFLASRQLESFGDWAEQLLAESTGKDGKGLIPVVGEPPLEAKAYGDDRVFVCICLDHDDAQAEFADELAELGHPVVAIRISDPVSIGAEMYRWEFATAVAGAMMGIDPFDQPNVQEAKSRTKAALEQFIQSGKLPKQDADVVEGSILHGSVRGAVRHLLNSTKPRDYVAIMGYLHHTEAVRDAIARIRVAIAAEKGVATTFGYGPRFLHSTGQLHKGGPDSGVFLQLTEAADQRVEIPGAPYDFATLKDAQAAGDLAVLQERGRRVMRVDLGDDAATNLGRLVEMITEAV
ncbi:MAG TPA: glucose-6-phosphate isomerase [Armatimonadetes bacterium]|nr:glucose-6-phosphate isomerase [Armatimonadota bacterium]